MFSFNVPASKERKRRNVFLFCLMFSQNDIQEGETDVPGNIHGVSLNKEIKKGAQATKCFPFCLMFSQKNQKEYTI